jgi:hypothetical protein
MVRNSQYPRKKTYNFIFAKLTNKFLKMEAADKQQQKPKRRIIIIEEEEEDEAENESQKENDPHQIKLMRTDSRKLRKCLVTSSWGDSLMGQVTLENKTSLGFQVREFREKDGRRELAPVLQIMLMLNGKACLEPVVTISEINSMIVKLDKFLFRKSELIVARILVHWVLLFLKTNYPKAHVFEFNLRTFGDDCFPGVKPSYWRGVFQKQFGLCQGGDGTPFPLTIEAAEEGFRGQLAVANASWIKNV